MSASVHNSSLHTHSTIFINTSQVAEPEDFYDLINGFGWLMSVLRCLQHHLEDKLRLKEEEAEKKVIVFILDLLSKKNKSENTRGQDIWNILEESFPLYHKFLGMKEWEKNKKIVGILIDGIIEELDIMAQEWQENQEDDESEMPLAETA